MSAIIECQKVSRSYKVGSSTVHALTDVTLSVERGAFLAITGPSGGGKSTLLHLLGAVDAPSTGRVMINGLDTSLLSDAESTRFRLNNIGFVFQRFYLMQTLTATENIELPMSEAGVDRKVRKARALELLDYVGLDGRASHRPAQLSGGEQQRVAVARALANEPSLILADEPTGELDEATGLALLELFSRLNRDGATLVFVSHDPIVARAAREVVSLRNGRLTRRDSLNGAAELS